MRHFKWTLASVIISDYWQCDFGARSIEERLATSNITIAEWVRTKDTIPDKEIDDLLQSISERARSEYPTVGTYRGYLTVTVNIRGIQQTISAVSNSQYQGYPTVNIRVSSSQYQGCPTKNVRDSQQSISEVSNSQYQGYPTKNIRDIQQSISGVSNS